METIYSFLSQALTYTQAELSAQRQETASNRGEMLWNCVTEEGEGITARLIRGCVPLATPSKMRLAVKGM